jgi:hypothetical protein
LRILLECLKLMSQIHARTHYNFGTKSDEF